MSEINLMDGWMNVNVLIEAGGFYERTCWLVRLLFTRWRRRRKGYNDGCQGGVIGRQYGVWRQI